MEPAHQLSRPFPDPLQDVGDVRPFEPIAIVGVGIRAPGDIDNIPSLWDTLVQRNTHHAC